MGQNDLGLKEFFSYKDSVAALANCCFFDNREFFKPEHFQHIDTTEQAIFNDRSGATITLSRLRDICCAVSYSAEWDGRLMILGIENQSEVDQFMAARVLALNTLNFMRQYKDMTGANLLVPPKGGAEFLGGSRAGDRFLPCVTIVLYLGRNDWTAPLSFRELVKDVEDPIAQYLPDIRIPLIAPKQDLEKIRGIREKNLFCLLNYLGDA